MAHKLVSEEMVEKTARAIAKSQEDALPPEFRSTWDEVHSVAKDGMRRDARAALEAVADDIVEACRMAIINAPGREPVSVLDRLKSQGK